MTNETLRFKTKSIDPEDNVLITLIIEGGILVIHMGENGDDVIETIKTLVVTFLEYLGLAAVFEEVHDG